MSAKAKELGRDELSLLLYLEARAVDHGGLVDSRRMNSADFETADRWSDEGFIEFGRVASRHHKGDCLHWCRLTDESFAVAHAERRARAARMWKRRQWETTAEARSCE